MDAWAAQEWAARARERAQARWPGAARRGLGGAGASGAEAGARARASWRRSARMRGAGALACGLARAQVARGGWQARELSGRAGGTGLGRQRRLGVDQQGDNEAACEGVAAQESRTALERVCGR
jgi:hypothetical protein